MMHIDEYEALDRERLVVVFPGHSSGWIDRREGPELVVEFLSGEQRRIHLHQLTRHDHLPSILFAVGARVPPPRPHLQQTTLGW